MAHYGVDTLAPTTALEDALMRIFVAHQRIDDQLAVVTTLLDRRAGAGSRRSGRSSCVMPSTA